MSVQKADIIAVALIFGIPAVAWGIAGFLQLRRYLKKKREDYRLNGLISRG